MMKTNKPKTPQPDIRPGRIYQIVGDHVFFTAGSLVRAREVYARAMSLHSNAVSVSLVLGSLTEHGQAVAGRRQVSDYSMVWTIDTKHLLELEEPDGPT